MIILGIETSCDETSASLVENGTTILSNIVASSQELHIKTGGIIPEMAAREQITCIVPVIQEALSQAHLNDQDVDAIAVTTGPGLIGSLLVGCETAKTLAYLWNKPIIPVNHLLAHVYANWLGNNETMKQCNNIPSFPLVALIVSGGHTELILMKDHGKYEWLGGTRDDAAGEAFDKIARLLGLGYPGGPAIAAAAKTVTSRKQKAESKDKNAFPVTTSYLLLSTKLPRPMINSHDLDFSFSGLKTAVLNLTKKESPQRGDSLTNQIAFEVQEAITDVLVEKTIRAARENNVKQILLSGGVAANSRLREKFKEKCSALSIKCSVPPSLLCTDNAAPIASYAFFNYQPIPWQKIQANPSLSL